jgi:hypothetical protein
MSKSRNQFQIQIRKVGERDENRRSKNRTYDEGEAEMMQ